YDDALDVVGVHLVGGIVGSLLLGFFADKAVNSAGRDGIFLGGGAGLLGDQFIPLIPTVIYSGAGSLVIIWVLSKALPGGVRVSEEEEDTGLDLGEHAEVGYSFAER